MAQVIGWIIECVQLLVNGVAVPRTAVRPAYIVQRRQPMRRIR